MQSAALGVSGKLYLSFISAIRCQYGRPSMVNGSAELLQMLLGAVIEGLCLCCLDSYWEGVGSLLPYLGQLLCEAHTDPAKRS